MADLICGKRSIAKLQVKRNIGELHQACNDVNQTRNLNQSRGSAIAYRKYDCITLAPLGMLELTAMVH